MRAHPHKTRQLTVCGCFSPLSLSLLQRPDHGAGAQPALHRLRCAAPHLGQVPQGLGLQLRHVNVLLGHRRHILYGGSRRPRPCDAHTHTHQRVRVMGRAHDDGSNSQHVTARRHARYTVLSPRVWAAAGAYSTLLRRVETTANQHTPVPCLRWPCASGRVHRMLGACTGVVVFASSTVRFRLHISLTKISIIK